MQCQFNPAALITEGKEGRDGSNRGEMSSALKSQEERGSVHKHKCLE